MRVLVIGAGGHGQVTADILLCMKDDGAGVEPIGFIDGDSSLHGTELLGLPVVGDEEALASTEHDAVVVAIGDNRTRKMVCERLVLQGEPLLAAIHPDAVLARDVHVAPGAMICAGAVVNTGSVIGQGAILNTGCTVDHHAVIGDYVHIAPGANLAGTVAVGEGAMVGIGSAVIPGRKLGSWCVVGAGAVVIRDVPSNSVVAGVPACPLG